nr:dienelactone hydrolase family protein [Alphaproteobacteria bacterium]
MGQDIEINATDGGAFAAYLALPETTPAPGIVLLPEVFNTNDHIRSVADGYAAEGFTVIAPDVYWRQEAGSSLTYTDEGRAKATPLRAALN